ncbi:unnamed protein product [Prorocentrum cordatum]|uniref:Glutaredoxin domain-containing protein n=1 Tax=Prorocentrum cordatum TaxID=2364126 RepID=A0ABN9QGR7_9DINO|nr:unnamed protein product [Polarella glacialis]
MADLPATGCDPPTLFAPAPFGGPPKGACVAAAAVQLEMPGGSNDCPDCTISGAPGLASVGAGPEAERGWGDRVSRLVSQNRVMVFSKSWCPYCARAKGALAEEFGPRGRGHGYVRRS